MNPHRIAIVILSFILLILILVGCKSRIQYVPVEKSKTEYVNKIQRDSIFRYDSVFVDRYKNGDTIFLSKEKYKYLFIDKLRTDTVLKKDSIQIPYPVIEYKEINELNWYQKACVWFTSIVLAALAIYLVIKYRGKILSFIRKLVFKV